MLIGECYGEIPVTAWTTPWLWNLVTPLRVCIARTMPWQDVCLSVSPSVCHTPVFSPVTVILNVFFTIGYPHHSSFFPYQMGYQYSDGDPLPASNARGYEKSQDFRPISRFISEMMRTLLPHTTPSTPTAHRPLLSEILNTPRRHCF